MKRFQTNQEYFVRRTSFEANCSDMTFTYRCHGFNTNVATERKEREMLYALLTLSPGLRPVSKQWVAQQAFAKMCSELIKQDKDSYFPELRSVMTSLSVNISWSIFYIFNMSDEIDWHIELAVCLVSNVISYI